MEYFHHFATGFTASAVVLFPFFLLAYWFKKRQNAQALLNKENKDFSKSTAIGAHDAAMKHQNDILRLR
jgi:hypothetical protein